MTSLRLTAIEIAQAIDGTVHGDENVSISAAKSVHQAGPETLTFAANDANLKKLANTNAAVAIVSSKDLQTALENQALTVITTDGDVECSFLEVAAVLHKRRVPRETGISPAADIASSARIGEDTHIHPNATISENVEIGTGCSIYPGVFVGQNVTVGDNVTLYPNVVIYDGATIGNSVTIQANAVIGADGFGYRTINGEHVRVPHFGTVRIEDNVEIGACSTIDRAKVGETIIGAGTKIDNLVMVAHNCELGHHNLLASQVGFAGSTTTGDYVVCGGQVGVADHVHLGSGAIFGAKCGVHRDMSGGQTYLGAPASPIDETRRQLMAIRKLPDMRKSLRAAEKQLAALAETIASLEASNPSQNSSEAA